MVYSIKVVGMHHYGSRQLEIGVEYTARDESSNTKDPNVIVVYEKETKVAYIKREHATVVSQLFKESVIQSKFFIKPDFESTLSITGSEQRCNFGFRCLDLNFECICQGRLAIKII